MHRQVVKDGIERGAKFAVLSDWADARVYVSQEGGWGV